MTTPPTPADWYLDPEDPNGLRYWDGASWTEHRAPAPGAPGPAAEPVSLPDEATNVYATRPIEQEPAPEELQQEPVQPYDTHPPVSTSPSIEPPVEPSVEPDLVPWDAPMPAWDSPSAEAAPTPQAPVEPPPYEAPAEPPPYEAPAEPPPYAPAQFAPPPGPPPGPYGQPTGPTGPSGDKPNTKLVAGILGGAAVILIVIAVVIALVVMRKGEPTVTSAQNTTQSSTTSSETTTSETESETPSSVEPTPPPTGAEATDGDYAFSVAGTETGDTITSTVSDSVETTADGMFLVVYLNVRNIGAAPLTFVATFQQLNAAGQTFPLDDEATAFLGGTVAEIAPGDQVETPLVYDVPVGTEADSILVRADPVSPGAELPLR